MYCRHPDPFFIKEEFAPSDREALLKRQQAAHNLLAPHSRLVQFLGSHFNATRLGSPHTQKIFLRMMRTTLQALKHSTGHPLARELRYQIVLFGLKALEHSTAVNATTQWRLKDQLLSAGLSWFAFAPRWSFGGNRLQIKSEARLLADVERALQGVAGIGVKATGTLRSLHAKEELLTVLLANEQMRLNVWLFPVSEPINHYTSHNYRAPTEVCSHHSSTLMSNSY